MLTGWPPFNGDTDEQIIKAIQKDEPAFNPEHWESMPLAKHLVAQMLTRDPKKRIAGPDILAHPWMKQFECGVSAKDLPHQITASLRLFGSMQLFTRLAHQAASVSLNPDEVTALRKAFLAMDRDDSGGITIDEFRQAMDGKLDAATVDAIFDKIDVNKSGDISYTEFLTASSAAHAVRRARLLRIHVPSTIYQLKTNTCNSVVTHVFVCIYSSCLERPGSKQKFNDGSF